jgi:dihydrofolate synthase/folylpolyglutamate synthase
MVSADISDACQAAQTAARPGDRIVVLGSFHIVAPVLALQPWLSNSPLPSLREA